MTSLTSRSQNSNQNIEKTVVSQQMEMKRKAAYEQEETLKKQVKEMSTDTGKIVSINFISTNILKFEPLISF